MPEYKYLIVGGGMAADAASGGIRAVDRDGSIGMIGAEPEPPYNRPPLSKALWKGEPEDSIRRMSDDHAVERRLGRTATSVDPRAKRVVDDRGESYGYDTLLLATGGTPRRLPFGGDDIIYYRTLEDYRRLRARAGSGTRAAVIGGGFIGSEIAAALAMNGCSVTMIFPEDAIGARVYPRDLAQFLNGYYREKGVDVLAGCSVHGYEARDGRAVLLARSGANERRVEADVVVAGIGITPNIRLAEEAGLRTGNGIEVDEFLRASDPCIFAAGDVAAFASPALGRRIRVEHEDNANTMGAHAGRNMAGQMEPYKHLPFFYSDLFELGYEAVGDLDARLETFADWKTPFQEGVVYYLAEGRVAGVLLWNVWGQVDAARALIEAKETLVPADLAGRLPA